MTLTLDTTVGGENADAYVDTAYVDGFAPSTAYGPQWAALSNVEDKKAAILRATRAIEAFFARMWEGTPAFATQALAHPRNDVARPSGTLYVTTEYPAPLRQATAIVSAWIAAQGITTDPFGLDDAGKLSSLTVGPIGLVFRSDVGGAGSAFMADVIMPMLDAAGLLGTAAGQSKLQR